MAKPNVPNKQTWDLFTAAEFNELKSAIDDNDTQVTQTKATVTSQGQELAQKPYRTEVIMKTDNPAATGFLEDIAVWETPSEWDILQFENWKWQEKTPTPTLNVTAYSKTWSFGWVEKANINYIFVADGEIVTEPIDFIPEKWMILIAKNDNKNPTKVLTLEAPLWYKIDWKQTDTVAWDWVESIYVYDDSAKNWAKTNSQTVVTELWGYTWVINNQLLDTIVSGIWFTKTPLTTYIDEKWDSVTDVHTVKVIWASLAQDTGSANQVNVTIPTGLTIKDKDWTSYDRTQEVQFLWTWVDLTAPTLWEPLKITINQGWGWISKVELKTRYAELSAPAWLPVDENILIVRYQALNDVSQPLPDLSRVNDWTMVIVENLSSNRDQVLTLTPANPSQNINWNSEFNINAQSWTYTFIADKWVNEWHVIQDKKAYTTILDKNDNEFSYFEKIKFAWATIQQPVKAWDPVEVDYSWTATELSLQSLDASMQPTWPVIKCNSIRTEFPIEVAKDPDFDDIGRLRIRGWYFERSHAPSYYATLNDDIEVTWVKNTGVTTWVLWFDDVIVPAWSYIDIDRNSKSIGLQEDDLKDPNITGWTAYLINLRVSFKWVAPEDWFIELFLRDKMTKQIINDWNWQPIGVKKQYKQDDKLWVLEITAIKKFKWIEEFQMVVEHSSFEDDLVIEDRTEGNSCIMIQALHQEEKTWFWLLQMENDLMANIEFVSHYMGVWLFSLGYYLQEERNIVDITPWTWETWADWWHLYNNTSLKAWIENWNLVIEDNWIDMAYFSFWKIISAEKTQLLRNKEVKFTIACKSPNNWFNVYLAKWTWTPDEYTKEIITWEDNDQPQVQTNWELLPSPLFISENVAGSLNTFTKNFTVPEDAENFAIVLAPLDKQQPCKIEIASFDWDVLNPFMWYFIHSTEKVDEKHLERSTKFKEIWLNTEWYASLRYTINQANTPMPAGKSIKWSADVNWNWAWTWWAVDFLTFNVDWTAKISTVYNIYPWESIPDGWSTQVTFWWTYESVPWTWTKIPASERSFTINKNEKAAVQFTIPEFEYAVAPWTKLRAYAKAWINDWAYIQSTSPHVYLCQTEINFDEIN